MIETLNWIRDNGEVAFLIGLFALALIEVLGRAVRGRE